MKATNYLKSMKLILAEFKELETERLLLRPLTLSDASAMYKYASDDEVTQFLSFPSHQSLEETENSIANFFINEPLGKYGIELKESRELIGTIDFQQLNETHKKAEIGYTIAKEYWGQGFVAEAGRELLCLAFYHLNLNVVSAIHDVDNPNSGRVMEKIGMSVVGEFPHYLIQKGKTTDVKIYAIRREDFLKGN